MEDLGVVLVLILAGIAYFVFPIWAANYASKRGHDGWAAISFLSIFIGLGPLGGLLAWLSSAGSPLESQLIDQYQRQCPNCGGYRVSGRRPNTKSTTYYYSCALCGYQWSWQVGTPWPNVQVRPDLITKGEQRLQEEAAERRRQEEAALYYLSQQRKK